MNTLKQRRNQLGLTQKQIATKLGMAESHYQAYELSTRAPSVYYALRIAKVLETTVEELWGQETKTKVL
jgi:putative transcriptional regulator